jgi:hypothetical protein
MRPGGSLVRAAWRTAGLAPALGTILLVACAGAQSPPHARDAGAATGVAAPGALPRVITRRAELLADVRSRVQAGDPALRPAYTKLLRDAKKTLAAPLVAVTDKHTLLPPSGDAHDYYSLSPYWWPDPAKADGLPYIRRDGETNPESKADLDQPRAATLGANLETLSLAWYLSGDEAYARRAAAQLRAWFIDPATRMNPHLRYAQLVRGNPAERGSGIVDTRQFIEAVDAASLLEDSRSWSDADQAALVAWFGQYLTWLRTSPNGQHEHDARNNHGSWYALQTASYALFTGDSALARQIVLSAKPRIGWQIAPDGTQPIEMERTRSYHYSNFNIEALSRLAEIGRQVGVDLWGYTDASGGSLRAAVAHVAPYVEHQKAWPGQQLDTVDADLLLMNMRRAHAALGDAPSAAAIEALRAAHPDDRSALVYPDPK